MTFVKIVSGFIFQAGLLLLLTLPGNAQTPKGQQILKSVQVQMINPFFLVSGTIHHYDTTFTNIHAYNDGTIYELPFFEDTADVPFGYGGVLKSFYLYTSPQSKKGFRFEKDMQGAGFVNLDSLKRGLWIFNANLDTLLNSRTATLQKLEDRELYLVPNPLFKDAADTLELHFTNQDIPNLFRLAPKYEAASHKTIAMARIRTSMKKILQGNRVIEPFQVSFTLSPFSPQDPAMIIRYFTEAEKRSRE